MHVVQLANFYGPTSGGLRTALDELAQRYVAAGHRCSLIVPWAHDEVLPGRRTEVRIRSPRLPGLGGYRLVLDRAGAERSLALLRPDVVELSDKTTLAPVARAARRQGVPTVLISHERLDTVLAQRLPFVPGRDRAVRAFNRRLVDDVDAVVVATEFAGAELDGLVEQERRHLVRLGVDLDLFTAPPGRPRGTPPQLVAAVRLSREKHPHLLVETSRELVRRGVDHRLTIYGDGASRRTLARDAADLPITFAGHVSDRVALAGAMAEADVGIAPGPHETFGLAALELLAAGTPVVVPDRGALPEMVTPTTGAIERPDGASFADGVVHLLAGDREEQRRAARTQARTYSWDRTASALLDIHERLLRATPARAGATGGQDAGTGARSNL